jgi:hypothetical protein
MKLQFSVTENQANRNIIFMPKNHLVFFKHSLQTTTQGSI